ncbi:MAG TPA: hypothetical protein VMV46_18095, partial [Thermoanaerobaculia bacterium]|nr:hypothetical protein [Thermoanaerobaculia bacterium]
MQDVVEAHHHRPGGRRGHLGAQRLGDQLDRATLMSGLEVAPVEKGDQRQPLGDRGPVVPDAHDAVDVGAPSVHRQPEVARRQPVEGPPL